MTTILLAADTSTSILAVGLCQGQSRAESGQETLVLAESTVECRRKHSERLLATVEWVLAEAGVGFESVDGLAITTGPGSFTGLRIGIAAWKGLAFSRNLPLVAVPTLDALSRVVPVRNGLVCPLLDARMKEVFAGAYRFSGGQREMVLPARAESIESFLDSLDPMVTAGESMLFLGDGARLCRSQITARFPDAWFAPGTQDGPRAGAVAEEAFALLAAGQPADAALAAPVYLRQSQAEMVRSQKAPAS